VIRKGDLIPVEEKSFEGESPRALGAGRGFRGLGNRKARREGSQTLGMGLLEAEAKATRRCVERRGEKKGFLG
jgi:hypothetical protein